MKKLNQLESFDLFFPTNIYSLLVLEPTSIYVSTYANIYYFNGTTLNKVSLSNISSQGNIISITGYKSNNGVLLGVTYQVSGEKNKSMFNLYLKDKFIQTIELNFTPLQLLFTELGEEEVFLLSGSDKVIHTFIKDSNLFQEVLTYKYFPELCRLPSCAVRFTIKKDYFVIGCQNGYLRLAKKNMVIEKYFDGPINSICQFCDHLVIGDAIGKVILFQNLSKSKLNEGIILKDSKETVLSIDVFDIFATGKEDIIVGTYSNILIYSKKDDKYELNQTIKMNYPVYGISCLDVNQDGCVEIFVVNMKNVMIFQPNGLDDLLIQKLNNYFKITDQQNN